MHDYLLGKWREERKAKKAKKSKSKQKHKDETPEERRARKERKREKKARKEAAKSENLKGVEALLKSLDRRDPGRERSHRDISTTPPRNSRRSYSPPEHNLGGRRDSRSRSPRPSRRRSPRSFRERADRSYDR